MGARPSSMTEMTLEEWRARVPHEGGWFKVNVHDQKASQHNNPAVAISPEISANISFYIDNIRPSAITETDNKYVFLTRGGKHIDSGAASQYAKQKWKAFVQAHGLRKAPETFCFGTQRRALQTL